MPDAAPDSAATSELLEQIRQGDDAALETLLARHRVKLLDFIDLHIDPRLRSRVDASDVVQDTHIAVVRRFDDFLARRPMSFRLWLQKTAYERLLNLRRDHVTCAKRSVAREEQWPDRSSLLLARSLLAGGPSPSQHLQAKERTERIRKAVGRLAEADREMLLLRSADQLSFEEIGQLLDIQSATARQRFGRALIRLQKLLQEVGLLEPPHE